MTEVKGPYCPTGGLWRGPIVLQQAYGGALSPGDLAPAGAKTVRVQPGPLSVTGIAHYDDTSSA